MRYDKKGNWIHRWFARRVWRKNGSTHWSSGPGNYTFDPSCMWCWFTRDLRGWLGWAGVAVLIALVISLALIAGGIWK